MAEFPSDSKPDEALRSHESSILPDVACLQRMLDAQRDRIHQQMDELQRVVVLQCQITGTNPLAAEMAAAVLGTRTGRRCGESLTPKAMKCLYNVFSIKDTITKKEAREISALCGATVTQVREFFSEQRSRVRKLVQLSHEEVGDQNFCFSIQPRKQNCPEVQGQHDVQLEDQEPHSSLFNGVLESITKGLNKSNGEAAENLIDVMRKESTFIGQIQLAQVILQVHQGPVLRWFMAKGGLQQIIKWLVQATVEEQTSLIRVLLKAVAHLPLGSAFPRQMSSLLQIVNKLRFYRAQDVASRARLLLSRWSKFFKNTLNARILSSTGSAGSSQAVQKRNRDVTVLHMDGSILKKRSRLSSMVDFSGPSGEGAASSSAVHADNLKSRMQVGTPSELELISTKKRPANTLLQADRVKERRKVQLFEGARVRVRRCKNAAMAKTSGLDLTPRPLSADDIKKAKRRAHLLQSPSISGTPKSSNLHSEISSIPEGLPCTSMKQSFGDAAFPEGRVDCNFLGVLAKKDKENARLTPKGENGPLVMATALKQARECFHGNMSKFRKERVVFEKNIKMEPCQQKSNLCDSATSVVTMDPADSVVQVHNERKSESFEDVSFASQPVLQNVREDLRLIDGCRTTVDHIDFKIIQWTPPPKMLLDPRWRVAMGEESTERSKQSLRLTDEQEVLYVSDECIPSNPHEPLERISLFVDDALVPEISIETVGEDSQDLESPLQSPTKPDEQRIGLEEADSKLTCPSGKTIEVVGQTLCQNVETTTSRLACTGTGLLKPNEMEGITKPVPSLALNVDALGSSSQSKLDSSTVESSEGEQVKEGSEVPKPNGMPISQVLGQKFIGALGQSLKACSTSHMEREAKEDNVMPSAKQEAENYAPPSSLQASSAGLLDDMSSAFQLSTSSFVSLEDRHNGKKPEWASNNGSTIEEHRHDIRLGGNVVKDVFSEEKGDAATIRSQTLISPGTDCLPALTNDMVAKSPNLQQNGRLSNQSLSSALGVSVSLHEDIKFQHHIIEHNALDVLGFNLSELSKKDCLDMLKVVLQQLADNSTGSGADLELLSVFLKNPELVYALTSSKALSSGSNLILMENPTKVSISGLTPTNSNDDCNLNSKRSEKSPYTSTCDAKLLLKTNRDLNEMVALEKHASLPSLAEPSHVRSSSNESAETMQLKPPLPPMPPPLAACVRFMDQVTQPQHSQNKLSHFQQPSSSQAQEKNAHLISVDVGINETARDWCQQGHALLHAGSAENAGFVTQSSMESSSVQRSGLGPCSIFPNSFQPRPGITTASLMKSSNQPSLLGVSSQHEGEVTNLILHTINPDVRGQPSAVLHGHHRQVNPEVSRIERQEVQVNGRNGSSFSAITNALLEVNLKGKELGPSVGILGSTTSVLSNERPQQPGVMHEMHARQVDTLPALMADTRGQIGNKFVGNAVPPKSTFVKPVPEHAVRPSPLLHPTPPSAKPPFLPVHVPPFASIPSRPEGNVMGWQTTAAQSSHQSYLRPGWRRQ